MSNDPAQDFNALRPQVLHVAYHVADIDRALAFYVGVLGMKEQLRLPLGKGLHEVILGFPESKSAGVILMWNTERNTTRIERGEGYSRFVLRVSNLEAALAHVQKHGAPIATPATSYGNLKFAMVNDPDGYTIELIELLRP